MLPRPTRAHYLGYIMRVVRYGRGYAGGIFGGGAIHPKMGHRNGALHPPQVSGLLQLRTLGFGYVLSMHMGMSGRPFPRTSEQRRVLGTSDQMTPPHTHTRTLRCTARSSTRSWLDCRAPTSIIHLQCYPRFKNLSSGCKSLELCADVASDVGIKAKSRLLRFL